MGRRVLPGLAVFALLGACADPPPVAPAAALPRPSPAAPCPGGLLCESAELFAGWRVPQTCRPQTLGAHVATCWLEAEDWQRVLEFFQSRYASAHVQATTLRVSGSVPPGWTPPLLIARKRTRGVELVFLPGDQVDMAGAATDTGQRAVLPLGRGP